MITLDMLGKPCPIPVVEAKKALAQGAEKVQVLVDNAVATQNLEKMATGMGYSISVERKGEAEFAVTITSTGKAMQTVTCEPCNADNAAELVILLTGDQIGIGEAAPAQSLMNSFILSIGTLSDIAQLPAPKTIILLNQAVKLAVEGAVALEHLQTLAEKGTEILSCGQCLGHYGLTEKLVAGRISNMLEIAGILCNAARVLRM